MKPFPRIAKQDPNLQCEVAGPGHYLDGLDDCNCNYCALAREGYKYVAYSKPKAMTEVTLLEQASYYRLLLAKEECSWGYAAKQLGVSKERLVEFMAELGLQPQLPTEINPHFPKEEDANE